MAHIYDYDAILAKVCPPAHTMTLAQQVNNPPPSLDEVRAVLEEIAGNREHGYDRRVFWASNAGLISRDHAWIDGGRVTVYVLTDKGRWFLAQCPVCHGAREVPVKDLYTGQPDSAPCPKCCTSTDKTTAPF